jgi:hypothetical protein
VVWPVCGNDLIRTRLGKGISTRCRHGCAPVALPETIFGPTKTVWVGTDPWPAQQGLCDLFLCFAKAK